MRTSLGVVSSGFGCDYVRSPVVRDGGMFRVSRCRSVLPPTWQGQIVLLAVHRLLVGICEINNSIIIPIVGNKYGLPVFR